MKRLFIVFSINLISAFVFSQGIPFPKDSATWVMDVQTETWGIPPQTIHNYHNYRTNGDTLISGYLYTIISTQNDSKYCFLREANDSIFCKYSLSTSFDTTEFTLYSFNHSVGDSLSLTLAGPSHGYFPGNVWAIDSILIGNTLHKRIRINSWIDFDFVEGVGALQGLMYPEIPMVDWWGDLTCFSRNDTVFSTNGTGQFTLGRCWYMTGIDDLKTESFSLSPNPTKNTLTLNTNFDITNITIVDISGNTVTSINKNSHTIDVSTLSAGIYFIRITLPTSIITERFIKN